MKKSFLSQYKNSDIKHGIIISILLVLTVLTRNDHKKENIKREEKAEAVYPYRTINALDSNHTLIAYEFHIREDDQRAAQCSAIIRGMNPEKDDYKTYCRSVVADIMKTMGTDKVGISIYDDYQAYELSEVKYATHFMVLNAAETDSVNKHTVATYSGDIYCQDGIIHTLHYYSEAGSRYSEKEQFDP